MTIREKLQQAMVDDLVTAEHVALVCKYNTRTVIRKANRGELPGVVRHGRSIRFRRIEVFAWLNSHPKATHRNEV